MNNKPSDKRRFIRRFKSTKTVFSYLPRTDNEGVTCLTKTAIKNDNDNSNFWTTTNRTNHLKNIQDSTIWDYELLETDKQMVGLDIGPLELSAFPVPDYDIPGKEHFNGIGYKGSKLNMSNY